MTDPASSPNTDVGKALFGATYVAAVFILYGVLEWVGVPKFHDKLLFVPVLNLMVSLFDGFARSAFINELS